MSALHAYGPTSQDPMSTQKNIIQAMYSYISNVFGSHPFLLICWTLLLFKVAQYIYRLTFHPLANFPGPRLAALSNLYGAYYDLVQPGKFVTTFARLHDRYGKLAEPRPQSPTKLD